MAALLAFTSTHVPAQSAPPAPPAGEIAATDVPQLIATLNGAGTGQEDRDTAARRLLARPDPSALPAIVEALNGTGPRTAQLSAARALSLSPRTDESLVAPLLNLLNTAAAKPQLDAAAQALTAFKNNEQVLTQLLAIAVNGNENARIAAVRAARTFVDKRVAALMIDLIDPVATPQPAINRAAREALGYLTGIDAATTDAEEWRAWWAANREKPDAQFRTDLAAARAVRYDQTSNELTAMADELAQLLRQQYRATPAERQPEIVLQYLRSASPAVRRIGCLIAADVAADGRLPADVQRQLRTLIGDADPQVRSSAAVAIGPLNDAEAFVPLLTQLQQETDPAARVAIATALRPYEDARAVPVLLRLLDDRNLDAVQAAAFALTGQMSAALRAADPAAADAAAQKIFDTLAQRTKPLSNEELREYLIRALTPLQSKTLAPRVSKMLTGQGNRERTKIRVALLAALGELRDPNFADTIAASLDDEEADVKIAAIRALGKVSNSAEYGGRIFDRTDASKEFMPAVRTEAWTLMKQLFAKATDGQLRAYAQKLRADAGRQVEVLRVLRDRARASGDVATEALLHQQIGDAAASPSVQRFEEATEAYRSALAYFRTQPDRNANEQSVSGSLMETLLRAKQYAEAMEFAQKQVLRGREFNDMVVPPIKFETERLIEFKDFPNARKLVDLAKKLPNLSNTQADNFKRLSDDIDERLRQQNRTPRPPVTFPQNASMPIESLAQS